MLRQFAGEAIGTAIMVFFGCGSVAIAVLFGAYQGLFQIAMVWGIGVALAIYASRHLSGAHLNPAVSFAMAFSHRLPIKQLPIYLAGQMAGAIGTALLLYGLLGPSIEHYEAINAITRGTPDSVRTAMMFGEFYPNPGNASVAVVSTALAMAAEGFGTFLLVLVILFLTDSRNAGRPSDGVTPLFIGLTVTAIISILAPLTQAGLNPARDLGPRLVAYVFGWGAAAMPDAHFGFLTVYVVGPILGGIAAAALFGLCIEPLYRDQRQKTAQPANGLPAE